MSGADHHPPQHRRTPARTEALIALIVLGPALVLVFTVAAELVHPISWGVSVAVPTVVGLLFGLAVRQPGLSTGLLGLLAIVLTAAALATNFVALRLAGTFCGIVYACSMVPLALLGWVCGALLRRAIDRLRTRKDTLGLLPMFLLAPLTPLVVDAVGPTDAVHPAEQMVFTRTIAVAAQDVWRTSLAFDDPDSSWQHVNAPLPQRATGHATAVRDEKTLHFAKGLLRVRIVAIEPGRRLVAEVLEQTIEARALRLHRVTFAVVPRGANSCEVSIALDHTPRMGPRWHWRPYERFFGGITFDAIVDDLLAPRPARQMADAR